MGLSLVTGPATEPLTVAEVKTHLRIGPADGEPAPAAPTVAPAGAGAGNVDDGAHRYRVTFVTADGETDGGTISAIVTIADKSVDGKVAVSDIALGGSAVTSRKVYRTIATGSDYLLLTTIADNMTTTFTDNVADGSLGAAAPATNTTNDPYLIALIQVGREWCEGFTRRAFVTQTWELVLDAFPAVIEIPKPPAVSVTSIKYLDTDGVEQTLAASKYRVETVSERARITPAFGEAWPSVRGVTNAVTVRFVAGYGAAPAVPQKLKQAMLLLIGELHERREDAVVGTIVSRVPRASEWLARPYRSVRF